MITEWNERQSLTTLFHRWSSVTLLTPEIRALSLLLYNIQGTRHRYLEIRTFLDQLRPAK